MSDVIRVTIWNEFRHEKESAATLKRTWVNDGRARDWHGAAGEGREFLEAAIFVDLADARLRIGHFIDYYNTNGPRRIWTRRGT